MDGNPGDLLLTTRTDLERLCDLAGRMGLVQLPLFRAAADGLLALVRIEDVSAPWPTWLIERNQHRPICFMLGGDPGFELFEVVGHGLALLAGVDPPHGLEFEPEPAAGKMKTENMENGCLGKDRELGPDGQKALILAQQPAGPGIGS